MVPAQGWHALIEKVSPFFAPWAAATLPRTSWPGGCPTPHGGHTRTALAQNAFIFRLLLKMTVCRGNLMCLIKFVETLLLFFLSTGRRPKNIFARWKKFHPQNKTNKEQKRKAGLRKRSTATSKNCIVETRTSPAPTNVPCEVQCKDRWYVGSLLDRARHQSGM